MRWRRATRKAGNCQVEGAPKQVYGTALTNESPAEGLEYAGDLDHGPPEVGHRIRIVAAVVYIFVEGRIVGQLVGTRMDIDMQSHIIQSLHEFPVEISHGAGFEVQVTLFLKSRPDIEFVLDKIEFDLKQATVVRDTARSKTSRRHVERYVPGMVDPGHRPHADLADNLQPLVEGIEGITPGGVIEFGPGRLHGCSFKYVD